MTEQRNYTAAELDAWLADEAILYKRKIDGGEDPVAAFAGVLDVLRLIWAKKGWTPAAAEEFVGDLAARFGRDIDRGRPPGAAGDMAILRFLARELQEDVATLLRQGAWSTDQVFDITATNVRILLRKTGLSARADEVLRAGRMALDESVAAAMGPDETAKDVFDAMRAKLRLG